MPNHAPTRILVTLNPESSESVPAILQLPPGASSTSRYPAVLLLHGFTSRKERMADTLGRELLSRNVANLAIDLPMHGARARGAHGLDALSMRNPIALVQTWRQALRDVHAAIAYLAGLDTVDSRCMGIAGYSLGAYLAVAATPDEPRIRAVALTAGGDLPPGTPFASLIRSITDPLRSIRSLDGRPLLMMNGTNDRTILPDQARALFAAANEPKEHRWYPGPHWPPNIVAAEVAEWLTAQIGRAADR